MSPVPILGRKNVAEPVADATPDEHRIMIDFPDDHTIDGMKFRIVGVSPEQIAVANLYLQRFGLMGMATREAEIAREQAATQAVRENLARERN